MPQRNSAFEPAHGSAVDTTALLGHRRERLAPYEVPADIAFVPAIPRTRSGKADLMAVRAHFATVVDDAEAS